VILQMHDLLELSTVNYQDFFLLESYFCAVIYCKIDPRRIFLNTAVCILCIKYPFPLVSRPCIWSVRQ
jgi:hypothetical protein